MGGNEKKISGDFRNKETFFFTKDKNLLKQWKNKGLKERKKRFFQDKGREKT